METFDFTFGPPSGAKKKDSAPLVVGVMADLAGMPDQPLPPVASRKFLEIDIDNFDQRLAALEPRLAFQVPNTLTGQAATLDINVSFRSVDDIGPSELTAQTPVLTKLWTARSRLAAMRSRPDGSHAQGAPAIEELLAEALGDPELARGLLGAATPAPEAAEEPAPEPPPAAEPGDQSDFSRLLGLAPGESPPRPAKAPPPPTSPIVQGLVAQALAGTPQISDEAVETIGQLVDRLDAKLAQQLSVVLHHPAWKTLEATWRGLWYLVSNTDTDENMKIRVLNLRKAELEAMFAREMSPAWNETPLFPMLRAGGFGCLIADCYFDHRAADVAILAGLGQLARAAGAPLLAGAAPSLFHLESWRGLRVTADLIKTLDSAEHAAWRQLRGSPTWRRIALALPRFLARLPYGRLTNPAEGLVFEELADVSRPADFVWANPAYAMGAVYTRAFSVHGWNARLVGGEDSEVDGLPVFPFTNADGDSEMMCPTEVAMAVEHGMALVNVGLMPLLHKANTDCAIFIAVPPLRG